LIKVLILENLLKLKISISKYQEYWYINLGVIIGELSMKALNLIVFSASLYASALCASDIIGAGASFPYPLYAKWALVYQKEKGIRLDYQSLGSASGLAQLKAKKVDFAATDMPLSDKKLTKTGLIQFPIVLGGIVVAVNMKALSGKVLKLTPDVLVDIFLGNITSWQDRRITSINPKLKLPKKDIVVVHRADGSGTTFNYTAYLADVSPSWQKNIGLGTNVDFPVGIGGKGNEGVAEYIKNIDGAIGYLEYGYAKNKHLKLAQLKNKAGNFISPSAQTFSHAVKNIKWRAPASIEGASVNLPGDKSWPILGVSYVVVNKSMNTNKVTQKVLEFFNWTYSHGKLYTEKLNYIPLPRPITKRILSSWKSLKLTRAVDKVGNAI
jgi:phosphate transport system substrate-binding protein